MAKIDPKEIADSVADGVISALELFPYVAEGVAKNAQEYASAVHKDLEEVKAKMPEDPVVIPRVVLGVVGQTIGAGLGMVEAVVSGIDKTVKDIKAQTKRVTE